ncbi:MAG: hypothetical protein ABI665_21515, partial [Vicinamibacterales bacterium]
MAALIAVVLPPVAESRQGPSQPASSGPARMRFVRSLDPSIVRGKPSVFSRLLKVIAGGSAAPTMSQPYGVAVGPDGQLYVADSAEGLIHVFGLDKPAYRSIRVDSASLIGIAFMGQRMIVTEIDATFECDTFFP